MGFYCKSNHIIVIPEEQNFNLFVLFSITMYNLKHFDMNQVEFFGTKLQFEIDSCDLKRAIHENENMYEIVDARSERAFRQEHIKGAISLSHKIMNEETVKHLDKSKIYITYCDGLGCNASTKGAFKLSELNFKVKELIGGIESWKLEGNETSSDLSVDEYKESMSCGPMCNCHN